MKVVKIVLIIIAVLVIAVISFMWYTGFFTGVKVEEKLEGGYKVVGIEFVGPYSKVGPSMDKVNNDLKAMGVVCTKGFGIYYDDPKTTPQEKCHSFVGNILEEKDYGKIEELKTKGFKVDSVSKENSLVIEFPVKNTLSYFIGPMKAYPAFTKYMKEKGLKIKLALEVYDMPNKKTIFIMQYQK